MSRFHETVVCLLFCCVSGCIYVSLLKDFHYINKKKDLRYSTHSSFWIMYQNTKRIYYFRKIMRRDISRHANLVKIKIDSFTWENAYLSKNKYQLLFQICKRGFKITAIPEEPFNNKVGRRAGRSDGSFCELSKFGTKSTCNKETNRHKMNLIWYQIKSEKP